MRNSIGSHPLATLLPSAGSPLGPLIRREIADLNREYLALGLEPALASDPRFCIPSAVRAELASSPGEVCERMARSPLSLFQLFLPEPGLEAPGPEAKGVADAGRADAAGWAMASRCQEFLLLSLATARQMARSTPLLSRLALGLDPVVEARLAAMRTAELGPVVGWPGLVRPRWEWHERFWALLSSSARADGDDAGLRRAHCVGLCLERTPSGGGRAAANHAHRCRPWPPRSPLRRRLPC